jgi:RimJ/RimL family protein N-acetyltransferase
MLARESSMRAVVQLRDYLWRPLTESDADATFVVALRNNDRYRNQFYNASSITRETHKQFIRAADERGEINWIIERDGQPRGVASIYNFDRANRSCECGRIVMLEPRLFFLSWVVSAKVAMDTIGIQRAYIETLTSNTTLANGVERMGMVRGRVLRSHVIRDGVPLDVVVFANTMPQWQAMRERTYARWGEPKVLSFEGERMTP